MDKEEILLRLNEELFRELRERRAMVVNVLIRVSAFFFILMGWKVAQSEKFTFPVRLIISFMVAAVSGIVCIYLISIYKSYKRIASVIVHNHESLGLFRQGGIIPNKSVFPREWKKFGQVQYNQLAWVAVPLLLGFITIVVLHIT